MANDVRAVTGTPDPSPGNNGFRRLGPPIRSSSFVLQHQSQPGLRVTKWEESVMPNKAIDNKFKKRGLKVAALAGGLVLVGGVAFAYWTQGGTGHGSAAAGDV